jgi:ABC-type multidrug transport system fused ATPase/permease subunit
MLVAEAVRTLMKGRTTIIIAHRLVTVTNADKIVVLDEGRIVGIGKHDALYASCPLYHKLYCTQFAEGQES